MNPIVAAAITGSVVLVVNAIAALIGVGRIIQRVNDLEAIGAQRHDENRKRLKGLKKDVRRINGTVRRHDEIIAKARRH